MKWLQVKRSLCIFIIFLWDIFKTYEIKSVFSYLDELVDFVESMDSCFKEYNLGAIDLYTVSFLAELSSTFFPFLRLLTNLIHYCCSVNVGEKFQS